MKLGRIFFVLSLLFLIFTLVGGVQAATTGTVTATVTAQNISLTISTGTVTYGTIALNSSKSTIAADLNNTQVVTNNGNVAEDFTIHGSNSASWTLDSVNTTQDHYIHQFCPATCSSPPTNFTALTLSDQALGAGNIAASGTQNFDLRITTPQTSSVTTQQTVTVTVTASAH